MKRTLILLSTLFYFSTVYAQSQENPEDTVKYWKYNGQISLSFSQVSLTNWAAGGDNSITANGLVRLESVYTKDKSSWDSYILAGYGLTKLGDGSVMKNDDKLELLSKYGYKASKRWDYSAVINGRTQFAPGYKNMLERTDKISDFFAPAYLTVSLGMDYKPSDAFALFLSPITTKFTFVMDDSLSMAGAYGVDPGKKVRKEFGGFVKMIFKKDNIIRNVSLSSNLDLFSNYIDHPERVDVNWDMLMTLKVNKFLAVTINTQLIYDYDIKFIEMVNNLPVKKSKVQFKELAGLGLTANF